MTNSNKTILIGNGPSILEKEMGEFIDSFGTIVRFNNYETFGYEKYAGTRTDIWSTRICQSIRGRSIEEKASYKEVIGVINSCIFTKAIEQLVPIFLTRNPQATIIHADQCAQYSQMFGYNPKKNWLTVGMITILYMLDMEYADKLYLYGFSGDTNKHYFKTSPRDPKYHNFNKEYEYIKYLEREGRVSIIL